jgi:hypothetical protein
VTVPATPLMRVMPALPAKAVPEAPRLGGLRRRNADKEGSRGQGAKNELHVVTSSTRFTRKTP